MALARRSMLGDHAHARLAQLADHRVEGLAHRRLDRHGAGAVDVRDHTQPGRRRGGPGRERRRPGAVRIGWLGAGDHAEQQLEVAHLARQRPDHRQRRPGRNVGPVGHEAERRLVCRDPAEGRRDAQRAAPVAAERERTHTCRQGGGGSARGAPGGAAQIPRIRARSVELRGRIAEQAQLGIGRLGEDHRAGSLGAGHGHVGGGREPTFPRSRPVGRLDPLQPQRVLDRQRQALERARRSRSQAPV